MLTNQRYFPIYGADGKLTRAFVVVSNADPAVNETVIDGNERVVRARLDDAKFFYEEDLKISLDEFRERLAKVAFQKKLGTVLQKSDRMEDLALAIAREAHLGADAASDAQRAAHLAKADLVSSAVVEFTAHSDTIGIDRRAAAEVAQSLRHRLLNILRSMAEPLVSMADATPKGPADTDASRLRPVRVHQGSSVFGLRPARTTPRCFRRPGPFLPMLARARISPSPSWAWSTLTAD